MSRLAVTLLALASILLLPLAAIATSLTVVSQDRSVSGSAYAEDGFENGSDGDSATSPGPGVFDEARHATVSLGDGIASGGGSQDSWILPYVLRAEGTHFSNAEIWSGEGFADASGVTHFEVTFDLAAPCGYTMVGFVEEFDNGSSRVTLDGPGGSVHGFYPPHNDWLQFDVSGTLPAGQYTLTARSSGSSYADPGYFDYSSGAFDFEFLLDGATDVPVISEVAPAAFPNPFRGSTRLTVPDGARSLRVFDTAGRLVRTLEGNDSVRWDGRSQAGAPLPAGVYYVRAEGSDADPVKLVRLR